MAKLKRSEFLKGTTGIILACLPINSLWAGLKFLKLGSSKLEKWRNIIKHPKAMDKDHYTSYQLRANH